MSNKASIGQVWLKREIRDLQPVVRTSAPFPLHEEEHLVVDVPCCVSGVLRALVQTATAEYTAIQTLPMLQSGVFRQVLVTKEHLDVLLGGLPSIMSGTYRLQVITREQSETLFHGLPVIQAGVFRAQVLTYTEPGSSKVNSGLPSLVSGVFSHA